MMDPVAVTAFVVLSTLAAGGVAYAVLQPSLEANRKADQRRTVYSRDENARASVLAARDRMQEQAKRRKSLQHSLKEMETKSRARDKHSRKPALSETLAQAGLKISTRQFAAISAGVGLFAFVLALILGQTLLVSFGVAVVAGFGLPRLVLSRMRKRRIARFVENFPSAIDLIVRGVKAGLPLNDTLRTVAAEVPEPVAGEFRRIVEAQQMGVALPEACERLYRGIPIPETNFFSIVIAIQTQAGGNLSEALGNLARVLRERKKMRQKVAAVSMEAKTSAGIIGALPVIVAGLVFMTTPEYIGILWNTTTGNLMMVGAGVWMTCGVLVMKKMINFDM